MSTHLLGKAIDLHGGGGDLVFPHHECEIAQAEPVTGHKPFVRVWLHTAMVEHEGAKMSKSLGNLVMVSDLLRRWPADALRLYLGKHHYRHPWSHDVDELAEADRLAGKLRAAATARGGSGEVLEAGSAQAAFGHAMNDDLDTATALARLENLADSIQAAARAAREIGPAQEVLRQLGRVFGLRLDADAAEAGVIEGWSAHLRRFAPPMPEPRADR
jgi:cysteinyl-tRNA synthetase